MPPFFLFSHFIAAPFDGGKLIPRVFPFLPRRSICSHVPNLFTAGFYLLLHSRVKPPREWVRMASGIDVSGEEWGREEAVDDIS